MKLFVLFMLRELKSTLKFWIPTNDVFNIVWKNGFRLDLKFSINQLYKKPLLC